MLSPQPEPIFARAYSRQRHTHTRVLPVHPRAHDTGLFSDVMQRLFSFWGDRAHGFYADMRMQAPTKHTITHQEPKLCCCCVIPGLIRTRHARIVRTERRKNGVMNSAVSFSRVRHFGMRSMTLIRELIIITKQREHARPSSLQEKTGVYRSMCRIQTFSLHVVGLSSV